VETLFYPAMLYSSRRIFIQTHYILWKHPILGGGAKPHSTGPIGNLCTILHPNFGEFFF
jgi:hypothetical protein